MRKIDLIVVHHSASAFGDVPTIRGWHIGRGFSDIGYHRVILNGRLKDSKRYQVALDGVIQPGRPDREAGAHALGHNAHSLGVCVIGNCNVAPITSAQLSALRRGLVVWCKQYNVKPERILGHREVEAPGYTECPGTHFPDLDELRAFVKEVLKT